MKKAIPLFLVGFMPYSVPLVWICLYARAFGTPISNLGFCLLLLVPAAFWLVGLAGVRIFLRDADRAGLVRINLLVKLAQIPAHLAIFGLALPCLTTPFTWMFVVFMALQDWMAVGLTGRIGWEAVAWCGEQGILSRELTARHKLRQSIPCADVYSAVWVYKKKERLL